MKRREPAASFATAGRVRRKRPKVQGSTSTFTCASPARQPVRISPRRKPARHAIQSPARPQLKRTGQSVNDDNQAQKVLPATASTSGNLARPGGRIHASTVLHPSSTLEEFRPASLQTATTQQQQPQSSSPAPIDDRMIDRRSMEVLLNRVSRRVGAPFTFMSPTVVLGIPVGTVRGRSVGKAVEVVGVPWGDKPSERKISNESWCKEFYWRIVLHQVAKRSGMSDLVAVAGRCSEGLEKLIGGGASHSTRGGAVRRQ